MPNAKEVSAAIEPGSLEYGDRQVVEDRIQGAMAKSQANMPAKTGSVSQSAQDRLASGPVSELPVTDGLSNGPGSSPPQQRRPQLDPLEDQYRLIAMNARSPQLRALARSALRAAVSRG